MSRDHPATRLQVNSCECIQQECVHFPGRLVGYSTVSRDLPSSQWHHTNSGNFTRVGVRISLKRLRARPGVYGSYLLCSLRQLSKRSPPADITTSKREKERKREKKRETEKKKKKKRKKEKKKREKREKKERKREKKAFTVREG